MPGFPHDASYKTLLSHRETMDDLSRGYFHENLTGEIDWDSLELVPSEYITDDLRRLANDLVWRLRRRGPDGEEEWIYIYAMLEFQSQPDHYMAARMMTYMGAFYQNHIARSGAPQGTKLPVIFPVVIYNGQREWNAACELDGLIEPSPPGLEEFRPALRYKLLEAWRCGEARTERNLAESIFRIERSQNLPGAGQVMDDLIEKFDGGEYAQVDRTFAKWLTAFVRNRYPNQEIRDCESVKEVRMQVVDELLPWGEHVVRREAREAAAKAYEETAARVAKETEARVAKETQARVAKETAARVAKETAARVARETEARVAKETQARVAKETQARVAKETQARVARETEARVARETEAKVLKAAEARAANARAEAVAEAQAQVRQEALTMLRRLLAKRIRDRFGDAIAKLVTVEIESRQDFADLDRIDGWIETCETGDSLLALLQTG